MGAFIRRLIGLLLVLTALAVQFVQAPERTAESLVARWAPRPSAFVEVRGQVVHLRDEGPRNDPHPIVMIHGVASSLHTWEGWAAALRERHRVIRFDLPGSGLTGPFTQTPGQDDYRSSALAAFTLELLDTLKLPRATLIGQGLGAEVAWQAAVLAPQQVERLVLLNATGLPIEPTGTPLALRLAGVAPTAWLGQYLLPRALVENSLRDLYGDPAKVSAALVDRTYELALREGNRHAFVRQWAQRSRGENIADMTRVKAPTLLIWGGQDPLAPIAAARLMNRKIAGSRLVVFDRLGHRPQEEDPATSLKALSGFVN